MKLYVGFGYYYNIIVNTSSSLMVVVHVLDDLLISTIYPRLPLKEGGIGVRFGLCPLALGGKDLRVVDPG
jgi:hypothetical protein